MIEKEEVVVEIKKRKEVVVVEVERKEVIEMKENLYLLEGKIEVKV